MSKIMQRCRELERSVRGITQASLLAQLVVEEFANNMLRWLKGTLDKSEASVRSRQIQLSHPQMDQAAVRAQLEREKFSKGAIDFVESLFNRRAKSDTELDNVHN